MSCSWCGRGFTPTDERVTSIDWFNHTADYLHGDCYEKVRPT